MAKIQVEAARRETAFRVTEGFYRLLEATALREVAETSVDQLQAHVDRARRFAEQGLTGKNDILRAEVILSNAEQRVVQARGGVELAGARLAMLLGLEGEQTLAPLGAPAAAPARGTLTSAAAQTRALEGRVEFREIDARIAQADRGVKVARSMLLPQINAFATYQYNTGSPLQASEAKFVGLNLSWDVWDWGATYQRGREAGAQRSLAIVGRRKTEQLIRLEARAAFVEYGTAAESIGVADKAVEQAEENLRVASARFAAQAGTSFDVLDAEALLTQTRAQQKSALYSYLIAGANVRRAMGEDPYQVAQGG